MINPDKLSQYIDINRYKSVLCLDGELPKRAFFEQMGLPVISADGATNKLAQRGITPDLIVGDLDSINPELLKTVKYERIIDQSHSDFQKALMYMNKHGLLPAVICGMSGGHIDHIANNISIFMQTSDNIFVTDDIIGYKLYENGIYTFPIDTKLSIIGMPECTLTTSGLKWELSDFYTTYPGQNSCFNRVVANPLQIKVKSGAALMMVYTDEVADAGLYL